jgi:hypothetical protein
VRKIQDMTYMLEIDEEKGRKAQQTPSSQSTRQGLSGFVYCAYEAEETPAETAGAFGGDRCYALRVMAQSGSNSKKENWSGSHPLRRKTLLW